MDQVLQQLGIDQIFSAPYHPQSNRKLEVFHKYLKPTLKKLCEKEPANWDKYINQVLASYRITPNLATAESPFFLVYGRDPNLPLHQLLEPMQCFLGDPDSGKLYLETHRLALAIARKTPDENRFTATQQTCSRPYHGSIHTATQDINNLYNLTMSLAASINFNQMILHIRSVFANLWDSLHYLCTVSTHTMDYIDATTSGILSPHVLPVVDLQRMLQHITDTLPPTLHLPISPVDTLHF